MFLKIVNTLMLCYVYAHVCQYGCVYVCFYDYNVYVCYVFVLVTHGICIICIYVCINLTVFMYYYT